MPRFAQTLLTASAIAVSLPFVTASVLSGPFMPTVGLTQTSSPSALLAPTLLRLGLDAKAFAAAGCSASSVVAAAVALDAFIAAAPNDIPNADAVWTTANLEVEAVKRKINQGIASASEVASLANLETTLAGATTVREGLLANAYTMATAGLSTSQVDLLEAIQSNSEWSLPTYFLVVQRSQIQWVTLRNALDEQRIAAKYEEPVSATSLATISAALGDPAVSTAKVNVDTNLANIQTAWTAAVN